MDGRLFMISLIRWLDSLSARKVVPVFYKGRRGQRRGWEGGRVGGWVGNKGNVLR